VRGPEVVLLVGVLILLVGAIGWRRGRVLRREALGRVPGGMVVGVRAVPVRLPARPAASPAGVPAAGGGQDVRAGALASGGDGRVRTVRAVPLPATRPKAGVLAAVEATREKARTEADERRRARRKAERAARRRNRRRR
jgi:hypothetical protein